MENKVENIPQVTLGEAKKIISALAATQSVLLLSSPGVGKSAVVRQAADEAGLDAVGALAEDLIAAESNRSAKRGKCSCGHDHEGDCEES